MITDEIDAVVVTDADPKYLLTESKTWNEYLGQFRNLERVKVKIIKIEDNEIPAQ